MNYVGKVFLFDYGEFRVKVDYLSENTLKWEQIEGPTPGLTSEETYHLSQVRNDVSMMSWQEKDGSVVVQVVDWGMEMVYTTWISSERSLNHFQGKVISIPTVA